MRQKKSEIKFSAVEEHLASLARGRTAERADDGEFLYFRRRIRPALTNQDFIDGEWVQEVCIHLTDFYNDLRSGKRPILFLFTPPQHGKSWFIRDFVAWASGKWPDMRTIFASYSDDLGNAANDELQRIFALEEYQQMFPWMKVGSPGWRCTQGLIEYPTHQGLFRNTTVRGPITGRGLDLGIIDDPHKGYAEANSKTERNHIWHWLISDFFSRMSRLAGLLVVVTRWHVDDMVGRYIAQGIDKRVKVLAYPAIAERTRLWHKKDTALFPQLKPLEFLMSQKKMMTEALWQAQYQQHPVIVGGGVIPLDKLRAVPQWGKPELIRASVRYWDKAGTEGGGAYTAGVLMHLMFDGTYVISDICRGQWSSREREDRIKATTEFDARFFKNYQVWVEREPGSGGKESAENTIRNLAGFRVSEDRVTGSKEVRAEPFVAQVQGDNVRFVPGLWVRPFLEECESWPNSTYLDQVDAAAGAFNKLAASSSYDTSYSAFQPGFRDIA